jgi:DNA-binding NarL/FixJ family response regulator
MKATSELQTAKRESSDEVLTVPQGHRNKRIFILEDHPMVRQGIRKLIESQQGFEVCGESESSDEGLAALSTACADLAIVDLSLKDSSGLDFIKTAKSRYPTLLTLVLSMHEDSSIIERALKFGASGYVSKAESLDRLIDAVQHVLRGEHYLSETVQKKLIDHEFSFRQEGGFPMFSLSDREFEVFQFLATGQPISKIAALLHLSVKTIEGYCAHIRKKLGLHNNQELIMEASRRLSSG